MISTNTSVQVIGREDRAGSATAPHFVVLLGGVISHNLTSADDHRLSKDFAPLHARLRERDPALRVIQFSYAVAGLMRDGRDPLEGWECPHRLLSGTAEARYQESDTTDLRLRDHVRALAWLIDYVLAAYPGARIDLIGFSLGGIVALGWAAQAPETDIGSIGRIILLATPVAGVTALGMVVPLPMVRHLLGRYRVGFGGGHIFRDLRTGSAAIRGLRAARDRVEIASIENTRDYMTNGRRIAGQGPLPGALRNIVLGRGAEVSGFLPPSKCWSFDLGGWDRHIRTTHHRMLRGRSPQIEAIRALIANLVLGEGPMRHTPLAGNAVGSTVDVGLAARGADQPR